MIGRSVLFVCWAVLGAAASYGALYLLTPYGLSILAVCCSPGSRCRGGSSPSG